MADEITITVRMAFSKSGAKASRTENINVDVTGDAFTHEVQSVGTSEEELAQGADLGTPGYIFLKNLDPTNYIEIGLTGSYTIKLKAGEVTLFRLAGASVYAKANTAACLCEYIILED
uniref:Uncharacterized protein n=1 Tax=viral metagenome TaxID=1070528 RepID=A0A6M3IZP3_9ZZZZ